LNLILVTSANVRTRTADGRLDACGGRRVDVCAPTVRAVAEARRWRLVPVELRGSRAGARFTRASPFPADTGTPIIAVASGLDAPYGRRVEVDHGNGPARVAGTDRNRTCVKATSSYAAGALPPWAARDARPGRIRVRSSVERRAAEPARFLQASGV